MGRLAIADQVVENHKKMQLALELMEAVMRRDHPKMEKLIDDSTCEEREVGFMSLSSLLLHRLSAAEFVEVMHLVNQDADGFRSLFQPVSTHPLDGDVVPAR